MVGVSRSRRRVQSDSAPGLLLVADGPGVSRFVRLPGAADVPSTQIARAIEDAVGAGVVVEFYAVDGDQAPAFRIQRGHGVLQVVDGEGRHLGIFASGAAAVQHRWEQARTRPLRTARKQP